MKWFGQEDLPVRSNDPNLVEAIKHLRTNSNFDVVLEYIRSEHNREYQHLVREQQEANTAFIRGRVYALGTIYELLAGKKVVE